MRITGYLVAALLGIAGGWLIFSPTEEAPAPVTEPPLQTPPPWRTWTPPPAPVPSWTVQPAPKQGPSPSSPSQQFSYRPLNEREQQRRKAGDTYPLDQTGYPPPPTDAPPPWAKPGYDYRPPERR